MPLWLGATAEHFRKRPVGLDWPKTREGRPRLSSIGKTRRSGREIVEHPDDVQQLGNEVSMKERQDRLEEACYLVRQLFRSSDPVTFQGDFYVLDDAPFSPGSFDKPIPIMVGGTGPKRTLRTLAMYGDIFNLDGWAGGPMTKDYMDHKWGILEKHCEEVGRDVAEISKTILMPTLLSDDQAKIDAMMKGRRLGEGSAVGSKNYVIDRVGEIIESGVDEIMFGGLQTETPEEFERFEREVLTAFS